MANNKAADDAAAELRAELKALREDFAELVETVKTLGREQADAALRSAKEAMEHASDKVRMTAAEARKKGEAVADEFEAAVVRHPLASLLIALGLGYIIGRTRH